MLYHSIYDYVPYIHIFPFSIQIFVRKFGTYSSLEIVFEAISYFTCYFSLEK